MPKHIHDILRERLLQAAGLHQPTPQKRKRNNRRRKVVVDLYADTTEQLDEMERKLTEVIRHNFQHVQTTYAPR